MYIKNLKICILNSLKNVYCWLLLTYFNVALKKSVNRKKYSNKDEYVIKCMYKGVDTNEKFTNRKR